MKKVIFCLSIALLFFSCTEEIIKEDTPKNNELTAEKPPEKIIFKGFTVRHRFTTPAEHIKERMNATKPGKVELALLKYSGKAVVKVADELFKNYPFPSEVKKFKTDLAMIKRDFPELSDKEIEENMEMIERYYDINLNYEALKMLEKTATPIEQPVKPAKKNRPSVAQKSSYPLVSSYATSASSGYDPHCTKKMPNDHDAWWYFYDKINCVGGKLAKKGWWAIVRIRNAGKKSKQIAETAFSGSDDQNDAKRHIYWNILLAKYYCSSSKSSRLQFAKDAGDAWEECGDNYVDASQMDIHNNDIGNDYFRYHSRVETYSDAFLKERVDYIVDRKAIQINDAPICYRKYTIEQTNSSIPVYLKRYSLSKLGALCTNDEGSISLNGLGKDATGYKGETVVWSVHHSLEIISKSKNNIKVKVKQGYRNTLAWVEAKIYSAKDKQILRIALKETFGVENSAAIEAMEMARGTYYVIIRGGNPPYEYYWNGNTIKISNSNEGPLWLGTAGGTLTVKSTNACGNITSASEIINASSYGNGWGSTANKKQSNKK